MSAPVLEAADLAVDRGGVPVLEVSSFRLGEGEVVALIGPNGSGKSSLLLSLMGLLPRRSGTLRWRGVEVKGRAGHLACRRRMALVLQEPLLFDETVFENVASGLRIRGVPGSVRRRRAEAALARFGLLAMARRPARDLSGGEARRVSLARALAVDPEVLLLDEPFVNLDVPARQGIVDDLEATLHQTGTAAILVTHDQGEALRLADRIAVMRGGRIAQDGPPAEVVNDPADEFVAACVGMETVVEGTVVRRGAGEVVMAVGGREVVVAGEAEVGEAVFCGIRPEQVTVEAVDLRGASSARNVLPAVVAGVFSAGSQLRVRLDCGFRLVASVTAESVAALGLAKGKPVFASFKATAVHLVRRGGRRAGPAPW